MRTLRGAVLGPVAVAAAAFAFASPAHAEDELPPPASPPVATFDKAVSDVPENVDDAVVPGASAPASPSPAPVEAPAEPTKPPEPVAPPEPVRRVKEVPANSDSWRVVHAARPRPVAPRPEPRRPVISPPVQAHPARVQVVRRTVRHAVHHRAPAAAATWYQLPRTQYQQAVDRVHRLAPKSLSTAPHVGSKPEARQLPRVVIRVGGRAPETGVICAREGPKCAGLCAFNVASKLNWNGRWIAACTSVETGQQKPGEARNSEEPDHDDGGAKDDRTDWAPRYHCPGAQYHDYWCDAGSDYGDSCSEEPADTSGWPTDSDVPDSDTAMSNDVPSSSCETPPAPAEPPVVSAPPPAPIPPVSTPPVATPAAVTGTPATVGPTLTEEPIEVPPPDAAPPDETVPPAEPAPAAAPPPEHAPTSSAPPAEASSPSPHGEQLGVRRNRRSAAEQHEAAPIVVSQPAAVEPVAPVKVQTQRPVAAKKPVTHKTAAAKSRRRTNRPASTSHSSTPAHEAQRPQPPGTPLASTSEPGRNWFVLMLMAAFALALVALALAAVSQVDGAAALARARSRLGSKGLSTNRVAFGDKTRMSRGIRYRD